MKKTETKTRKIEIFDLLPKEAIEQIDKLGYEFLKANGYDTDGAIKSDEKRRALKKSLQKDGKKLVYFSMIDKQTKAILFWFELHKGEEKIATSKGLKFLPREGVENGKRENQERSSEASKDNA